MSGMGGLFTAESQIEEQDWQTKPALASALTTTRNMPSQTCDDACCGVKSEGSSAECTDPARERHTKTRLARTNPSAARLVLELGIGASRGASALVWRRPGHLSTRR